MLREGLLKNAARVPHSRDDHAETRIAASQSEIPVLTGLRGIAALLVFGYHLPWLAGIRVRDSLPYGGWMSGADAGVGLFFCLSAYLLSRPFWAMLRQHRLKDANFERFLLRRVVRIFPAYLVVVAWSLLPDDRTATFWGIVNLIAHTFALQTYFHQNFVWMINSVLWTVSIEVQFYFFLAAAFWIATRIPLLTRGSGVLLLLIFVITMIGADPLSRSVFALLAPLLPAPVFGGSDPTSSVYTWNIGYFLKWFLPGIVAAWISVQTGSIRPKGNFSARHFPVWGRDFVVISLLAAIVGILAFAREGDWRTAGLLGWPLNALAFAVLVLVSPYSRLANFLFGGGLITWFGTISYGLYLWHYPIVRAIGKAEPFRDFEGWVAVASVGSVGLAASVMAAAASWYLLERPVLAFAGGFRSFGEIAHKLRGGQWP